MFSLLSPRPRCAQALKLSVNDFFRFKLRNPDGSINLANEGLAGGLGEAALRLPHLQSVH